MALRFRRGTSTLTAADQLQRGDIVEINDTAKLAISLRNIDHTPAAAQLDYMVSQYWGEAYLVSVLWADHPYILQTQAYSAPSSLSRLKEKDWPGLYVVGGGVHAFAASSSDRIPLSTMAKNLIGSCNTRARLPYHQSAHYKARLEWSLAESIAHWGSYLDNCGEMTRAIFTTTPTMSKDSAIRKPCEENDRYSMWMNRRLRLQAAKGSSIKDEFAFAKWTLHENSKCKLTSGHTMKPVLVHSGQ